MAISREEIDEIAKEVARRVIGDSKPCRCGQATWGTRSYISAAEEAVKAQSYDAFRPLPRQLDSALTTVEESCAVSMLKAKKPLEALADAADKGNWEVARNQLIHLTVSVSSEIKDCAGKKEAAGP